MLNLKMNLKGQSMSQGMGLREEMIMQALIRKKRKKKLKGQNACSCFGELVRLETQRKGSNKKRRPLFKRSFINIAVLAAE